MVQFIVRRTLLMAPTLLAISVISFVIIELPPGDYVTDYIAGLQMEGTPASEEMADALRVRFGLDRPWHNRYLKWAWGFARGDFGFSLSWRVPVSELIRERLILTLVVSLSAMGFTWLVALPIGVYSAVRQYSVGDSIFTFIGFLGLSIPNFLLALVLMFVAYRYFGSSVGGLFSQQFVDAPWTLAKVADLLNHLWIPTVVVGTAGTAGMIRVMRANLLDELRKAYVTTARARGLPEGKLLIAYPIRVAINPFISTVGWLLPNLFSGAAITAIVLSLPTMGPLFLQALRQQDMYLAGSFIMITAVMTVAGTLLSDILLAVADPRIRHA